jgi:hypothetical protein
MLRWGIYYGQSEYAKVMGDPCLATVEADSKEGAEQKAREQGVSDYPAGLFASPLVHCENCHFVMKTKDGESFCGNIASEYFFARINPEYSWCALLQEKGTDDGPAADSKPA